GPQHAQEHPDRRALAGAVGADQAEGVALRDTQGEVVDRRGLDEAPRDAGQLDGHVACGFRDHWRVLPFRRAWSRAWSNTARMRSGGRPASWPTRTPCRKAADTAFSVAPRAERLSRSATNNPTPRRGSTAPSRSSSS